MIFCLFTWRNMILYTGYVMEILINDAPQPHTNSSKLMCQKPFLLFFTISSLESYTNESKNTFDTNIQNNYRYGVH